MKQKATTFCFFISLLYHKNHYKRCLINDYSGFFRTFDTAPFGVVIKKIGMTGLEPATPSTPC